jgi:hypothetical protein
MADMADNVMGGAYCKRAKLGIAVGTICLFLSVGVVGTKFFMPFTPFVVEFGIAIICATLHAFGVAYITSNSGPGAFIGNLYYFSWISFLLSAYLVAAIFGEHRAPQSNEENGGGNKDESNGDIEVHNLDVDDPNL